MKPHLPKMLVAALIAAFSAISANADETAQTVTGPDVPYSGTIYTWNGDLYGMNDVAYGQFYVTTYEGTAATVHTDQVLRPSSSSNWTNIRNVFGNFLPDTAARATLRFDGAYGTERKAARHTFGPFNIGGIIVESGATGYSIVAGGNSNSDRQINLGNMNGDEAYSRILENFTINKNTNPGNIDIYGPSTFEVAQGKSFTLKTKDDTSITLKDDLTVKGAGTVDFAQGRFTMDAGSTLTVEEGATVRIAGAATLASTIENAGSVNFGGAVTLSASLDDFKVEQSGRYEDYQGNPADNGYFAGVSKYTIITGAYTGMDTLSYGGHNYTVENGVITVGNAGDVDKGTYHMNTAAASLDLAAEQAINAALENVTIAGAATGAGMTLGGAHELNLLTLSQGSKLSLSGTGSLSATLAGTGTLDIASGIVVRNTGAEAFSVVLSGEGTYALGPNTVSLGSTAPLGSNWRGVVRLSGSNGTGNVNLSPLVNGNNTSWVEFNGFKGFTNSWASSHSAAQYNIDFAQNVILTDTADMSAFVWTAAASSGTAVGYEGYTSYATGDWKGTGTLQIEMTGTNSAYKGQSFRFSGDISQWKGKVLVGPNAGTNSTIGLHYQGDATEINTTYDRGTSGHAKFHLYVGDGENPFTASFNKEVDVDNLTINANATAILKGSATLGGFDGEGTLKVDAGENTVTIAPAGSLALHHTISLASGRLVMDGTFNIDALQAVDGKTTYERTDGIADGNGFKHTTGSVKVVDKTGGTLNVADATFMRDNKAVSLSGDGTFAVDETDYTTLWVNNTGAVSFNAAYGLANSHSATLGTVRLATDGASVTFDKVGSSAAIQVEEGVHNVTLQATKGFYVNGFTGLTEDSTITIAGSGTGTAGDRMVHLQSPITVGNVVVDGGSLSLGNDSNVTNLEVKNGGYLELGLNTIGTLTVTNAKVSTPRRYNRESTPFTSGGSLYINEGGYVVTIEQYYPFGYTDGTSATMDVYLTGADGNHATLEVGGGSYSTDFYMLAMSANLHFNGHADIISRDGHGGFYTFGGNISVSGEENSVQHLELRSAVSIDVEEAGELEIAQMTLSHEGERVLTKEGAGKLTFAGEAHMMQLVNNGGTTEFNGVLDAQESVTLNGGKVVTMAEGVAIDTLNLNAGELAVEGGATLDTVIKKTTGAAALSGSGTTTLSKVIGLQGGSLAMSGTYNVDALEFVGEEDTYTGGADPRNGFAVRNGYIQVVAVADETELSTGEAVVMYDDARYTLSNDGKVHMDDAQYDVFYVNTGTETLTTAKAEGEEHPLQYVHVAEDATLDVDQAMDLSLVKADSLGTLNIREGATLTAGEATTATKIAGTGTFVLKDGSADLAGASMADTWAGTVSVGGTIQDINLNSLGQAGSKVVMDGTSGYFAQGRLEFTPHLELGDGGLTLTNGYSDLNDTAKTPTAYTFAGGISGTGDMVFNDEEWNSNVKQHLYFTGDIAAWSGALVLEHGFTVYAQYSGVNKTVNTDITRNGGTLNVEVGTGSEASTVTFTGAISATSLTVNAGSTANFTGGFGIVSNGSISVGEDATLNITGNGLTHAITSAGTVTLTGVTLSTSFSPQGGSNARFDITGGQSADAAIYYQGTAASYLAVVTGEGAANATGTGLTCSWTGQTGLTMQNGIVTLADANINYTRLYVGDAVSTSAIQQYGHFSELNRIEIVDGGTLVVDQALSGITIEVAAHAAGTITGPALDPASITIDSGATAMFEAPLEKSGIRFTAADEGTVNVYNPYTNSVTYDINRGLRVTAEKLEMTGDSDTTVQNRLDVDEIVNESGHTLKLTDSSAADNVERVKATGGDIEFVNIAQDATIELKELVIGESRSASFNTSSDVFNEPAEATVVMAAAVPEEDAAGGALNVMDGATLRADLVMMAGSSLDVSQAQEHRGLIMGSEVTLNQGVQLVNGELDPADDFNAFLSDYLSHNDFYYLYDNVEQLYIQQGDTSYAPASISLDVSNVWVDASTVFTNLNEGTYALVYNWDADHHGTVALKGVPEPTTGTLSLLALAALAARRRRK